MMCEVKDNIIRPTFGIDNKRVCINCGAIIPMKDLLAYNIQSGTYQISFKDQILPVTTFKPITIYGCEECGTLNISNELPKGG